MNENDKDLEANETEETLTETPVTLEHKIRKREHLVSSLTGMSIEHVSAHVARRNRKTVSDLVVMLSLPEEKAAQTLNQVSTSANVLTKSGYAPSLGYSDLRMAEEVQANGTASSRKDMGISESEHTTRVEEDEEDDFVFNHVGHTSKEAAELLAKYGRNELPEKVDPKVRSCNRFLTLVFLFSIVAFFSFSYTRHQHTLLFTVAGFLETVLGSHAHYALDRHHHRSWHWELFGHGDLARHSNHQRQH